MSAPVLFVNIMCLSYVLHCCNEGCSCGQSVLIVLIWSCASGVICQWSCSHEVLQIGQGAQLCSELQQWFKTFQKLEGAAKGGPLYPPHSLLLLMATGLIQPLGGGKQQMHMREGKQRAARGLLTFSSLLREEQRKGQPGTAKNGISSIQV